MKAVEFCCGYGGATEGMLRAGLTIEAAYDNWPTAVEAHRQWHPTVPTTLRDVSHVLPHELAGRFVWASLPCQPWSLANQVRRGKTHPHYYSLRHFARQVRHARAAVIENVPGLVLSKDGREELTDLHDQCHRQGMTSHVYLVSAGSFGIPQLRKRAIITVNVPLIVWPEYGGNLTLERAPLATETTGQTRGDGHVGRTVEHKARLQGVPVPVGFTQAEAHALVGNAVPPVMAEGIARAVLAALQEEVAA